MLPYLLLLLSPLACHATTSLVTEMVDSTIDRIIDTPSSIHEFDRTGKYTWELLFDIDNSNNARELKREVEVITSIISSYKDLKQSLQQSTIDGSTEASLGGKMFEVVSIGVTGALNDEVKLAYDRLSESDKTTMRNTTKKDTYTIGANSKLKLYRLIFTGPGITYKTDTLSSTPREMEDVQINFKLRQLPVLKDILVEVTKVSISRPANHITEANGKSPNVNSGFGGDHIWLVPVWTTKISEGATGIQIAVQEGEENKAFQDLASGAGGKFRYIKMLRDAKSNKRITQVSLFRSTEKNNTPLKNGWQFMTTDINEDRKGEYLWIGYNSKSI